MPTYNGTWPYTAEAAAAVAAGPAAEIEAGAAGAASRSPAASQARWVGECMISFFTFSK